MKKALLLSLAATSLLGAPAHYDLLLKGGHVIDPKSRISAVRDVAISGGKIAAVAASIDAIQATKTVDASGLYVTPGLVDIHTHLYTYTGNHGSMADDHAIVPDSFAPREGVTTMVDAGSSGWRTFDDFKWRIVNRSRTRVLAFINIVGQGMRGGKFEQDLNDMDGKATGGFALKHKDVLVGIKSAHFAGPEWKPYEQAVIAGETAKIPVMIDYGANRPERPIGELFAKVLRPGDIYTHMYSGLRGEQADNGGPSQAMIDGRARGIIFDVGHGSGSFLWRIAVPLMKAGFIPDSISTDMHTASMNTAMKDLLNVMSKFLAMGMDLDSVILRTTWNPAREIKHEEFGNLGVGSVADVALLRIDKGKFGFVDMNGARMDAAQKLVCEMTIREGRVIYDLNGLTRERWDKLPPGYKRQGDASWDGYMGGHAPH